MNDEYQQPYYQEAGSGTPWKKIAIIVGAVLVAIAVIIMVVVLIQNRRATKLDLVNVQETIERTEDMLASDLAECEDAFDPEACRNNVISTEASETGSIAVCSMLEGTAFDNCIFELSNIKSDYLLCETIVDQGLKDVCQGMLLTELAEGNEDFGLCTHINDEEWQSICWERVEDEIVDAGLCDEYSLDPELCKEYLVMDEAQATADVDKCYQITDMDLKSQCIDGINSTDYDNDGLTREDEASLGTSDDLVDTDGDGLNDHDELYKYHTDPLNSDTDGDGYGDGIEVAGGYDPLGSGSL
jgi:hypothetical protein